MNTKIFKKATCVMTAVGIILTSNSMAFASSNTVASEQNMQVMAQDINHITSFTNGFAAIAKGAVLTKGASEPINISISASGVTTEDDLKDFIKNNKDLFTQEQYDKIIALSAYTEEGYGADLLKGLLSIVFNGGSYSNIAGKEVAAVTTQQEQLLDGLYNLKASNYTLKGTRTAIGDSYIPTQAYCYVQTSKLAFEDGRVLKLINTSTLVADSKGITSKVHGSTSDGNLQLIAK